MSEANSQTILLVEDDKNLGPVIQEVLVSNNYSVMLFSDPVKALQELDNNKFDLIILDELLPKMTGTQAITKIRANNVTSGVPILMITSIINKEHEVEALELGADDYINKPFRLSVFLARVKSLLKRKQSNITFSIEVPPGADPAAISDKEKEVLQFLAQGYNNNRISKEMIITEYTVASHVKNIFSKLKVENRTQAAIIALKLNII